MAQTFRVRWEISFSLRTHPHFFAAVAHNVSVQRFLRAQLPRSSTSPIPPLHFLAASIRAVPNKKEIGKAEAEAAGEGEGSWESQLRKFFAIFPCAHLALGHDTQFSLLFAVKIIES